MAVKKEFEFDSFDELAQMLQNKKNDEINQNTKKTTVTEEKKPIVKQEVVKSKIQPAKRYSRKNGPSVININEYKERAKKGFSSVKKEKKLDTTEDSGIKVSKNSIVIKKSANKKSLKLKLPEFIKKEPESIAEKTARKISRQRRKEERKKQRRITAISKNIQKNVEHELRYTEPKKRNLLGRIILQNRLAKGSFDDIEDEYEFLTQKEVDESKNAERRRDRRLYKEVQAYEDAREDITVRKGWMAFKIGLAAALLAGSLALVNYTGNEVEKTFANSRNAIVSIDTIPEESRSYYEDTIDDFIEQVKENNGYEFDYLSEDEILDGYLRIKNKESKMLEGQFRGALVNFKDQELLDDIVLKSFGEEEYLTFSEEQKRDYRQLAFELLPISLPKIFEDSNYIRNPIVYDALQAKNDAKSRGYKINLIVNSDEEEAVKNIGRLMHIENTLQESDYQVASSVNDGQDLLNEIVRQALADNYETTSEKDIRDYKQIAYELLPDDVKEEYIKDPIILEKAAEDMEIGE